MKKITSEIKYQAADGREFTDPEAARQYEQLAEALRAYKAACRVLTKCAAELSKTADGVEFRFDVWHGYYTIMPGDWSLPQLRKVGFWQWQRWALEAIPPEDNGTAVVLVDVGDGKDTYGKRFSISELYYDEGNARKALFAAQEKWLAERTAEVAADKAKQRDE